MATTISRVMEAAERHPGEKTWRDVGRDQMADLVKNHPGGDESTAVSLKTGSAEARIQEGVTPSGGATHG